MENKFSPLISSTRSSIVFGTIKDSIFTGYLKPGEALKELHLARDFKVSQATVREALIQLEQFGLVEKDPHKGTRVVNKSDEEINELILIRFQLEELAAILASKKMVDKDFKHLMSIERKILAAVKKNQYFELIRHDLEFHKYIWEKSGNTILAKLLEQVTVPLFAVVSIKRSKQEQALEKVVNSHQRVVDAIASKDSEKIKLAYQTDLEESYGIFI